MSHMERFRFFGRREPEESKETKRAKKWLRSIAKGEIKNINITPEMAEGYLLRMEKKMVSKETIRAFAANQTDYEEARGEEKK